MSKNTQEWLSFAALIFVTVCAVAVANQRDNLKQEAVDRGFAEWKVIGQNKTEFVWKEKQ